MHEVHLCHLRAKKANHKRGICMKLISIGYANFVNSDRIISLVTPDSAPIKRVIREAQDKRMLIDATCGRKTRTVLVMDSDHVVLSAFAAETIALRASQGRPLALTDEFSESDEDIN